MGKRGPNKKERSPDDIYENYYKYEVIQSAKRRGLNCLISLEQCKVLITSVCHYCGAMPSRHYDPRRFPPIAPINGIDRIDNSLGYVPGNVVSCCPSCNKLKGTLENNEFLQLIAKIYEYQTQKISRTV